MTDIQPQAIYHQKQVILLCSDIHIQSHYPARHLAWLKSLNMIYEQYNIAACYILGDLFDYWIGSPCIQTYQESLAQLQNSKILSSPVYFMRGNRDFMITEELSSFGIQTIPDPSIIYHGSSSILLSHGDLFCSQDRSYQSLRSIIQHPLTKKLVRYLPTQVKYTIANHLRQKSKQYNHKKSRNLMQTHPPTIDQYAQQYSCKHVIHGHVHKAQQYSTQHCHVTVLDSWEHQENYALITQEGIKLITLYDHHTGTVLKESASTSV